MIGRKMKEVIQTRLKFGKDRSSSRVKKKTSLKFCSVAFLVFLLQLGLVTARTKLTQEQVDQLNKFIEEKGGKNMSKVTYEMLSKWFDERASAGSNISFTGYPRLFPFCVTAAHLSNSLRVKNTSHLFRFQKALKKVERENRFFFEFDDMIDYQPMNTTFIESFKFTRINTPEADMVNLRQWVHITVRAAVPLQGLYLQSIVGPLGIPSGEFSLEFPCQDLPDSVTAHQNGVGQLEYCMYRPRTNIVHPSVYVGYDSKGRREWHVHFRWFDLTCMQTPYIQFLTMAVKTFKNNLTTGVDFIPQFSTIMLNTNFDTYDGTPYPYYPGWEESMYCNIQSDEEYRSKTGVEVSTHIGGDMWYGNITWKEYDVTQIQPNEVYDFCVTTQDEAELKKAKVKKDDERFECPPGPFRCTKSLSQNSLENITAEREKLIREERNISECDPCAIPRCEELNFEKGFCTDVEDKGTKQAPETAILKTMDFLTRGRAHGAGASVAFLVFIPVANYIARFCKDMGGKCVFGNGPWLLLHCVLNFLAIVLCCDSAGNVFTNFREYKATKKVCIEVDGYPEGSKEYEECMHEVALNTPHNWFGIFTLFFLVVSLSTGFVRPSASKLRCIISLLHSHIGYFTWLMGVATVFIALLTKDCPGVFYFIIGVVAVPLLFSVAALIVDIVEDVTMGIRPWRRHWPVYEQIELDKHGPLWLLKWIIFGGYLAVMFSLMIVIVANVKSIEESSEEAFAGLIDARELNKVFGKFEGFLGKCTPNITRPFKGVTVSDVPTNSSS